MVGQQVPTGEGKSDPSIHLLFSNTCFTQTTDQKTKGPRGIDFSAGGFGCLENKKKFYKLNMVLALYPAIRI